MGTDDGVCDQAGDGLHRFELDELTPAGVGLAQVHRCMLCGATSYQRSAADDPHREP